MSILHSFGERLVLYLRTAPCHAKILQNCQPKPDPISRIHRPIVFSFFIACLVSLSLSLDLGNQRSESSIPWGLCLATCLLLTHITSANFGHPILRLHPLDMDSALCKIRTRVHMKSLSPYPAQENDSSNLSSYPRTDSSTTRSSHNH
ncbi:unnamed protein product [Linum tenue]|uniref:Uncharacterized protein n=1 Tax=Linum tenue TaxID=586396 RepID=A0AAV0JXI2_9ROSI|nr:unnamed protein product [Linum tenue]